MNQWNAWLHAARLRTLPLALSCVIMGGILAYIDGKVNLLAFLLALASTVILQVLSNFANDYGDFTSGVDVDGRIGPKRALQSGLITKPQMKTALYITSSLALVSGILLLLTAHISWFALGILLAMGVLAILAAITYTIGDRPYGYQGLGDFSVFIFFGLVGVLGSHYVVHGAFISENILMAATCGLFSVGVLNLNNIRDLEADKIHQKNTIPVWMGIKRAKIYQIVLITVGWLCAIMYTFSNAEQWSSFLFLLSLPFFIKNTILLLKRQGHTIDPLLKQLALSTLLFVLLFGIGWILL